MKSTCLACARPCVQSPALKKPNQTKPPAQRMTQSEGSSSTTPPRAARQALPWFAPAKPELTAPRDKAHCRTHRRQSWEPAGPSFWSTLPFCHKGRGLRTSTASALPSATPTGTAIDSQECSMVHLNIQIPLRCYLFFLFSCKCLHRYSSGNLVRSS